jgi:hypothetical protein
MEHDLLRIARQKGRHSDRIVALQQLFARAGEPAWDAALRMTDDIDTPAAAAVLSAVKAASLAGPCGTEGWCAAFAIPVLCARLTSQVRDADPWIPATAPVRAGPLLKAVEFLQADASPRERVPALIPANSLIEGLTPWTPVEAQSLGTWVGQGFPAAQWPGWTPFKQSGGRLTRRVASTPTHDLIVDPRFIPMALIGRLDRLLALGQAPPQMHEPLATALHRSITTDYEVIATEPPVSLCRSIVPLHDMAGVLAAKIDQIIADWRGELH